MLFVLILGKSTCIHALQHPDAAAKQPLVNFGLQPEGVDWVEHRDRLLLAGSIPSVCATFTLFYSPIHLTHHIPRRNPQHLAQLENRPKARTFATKLQLADVVARQPGFRGKGFLGQCTLIA